MRLAEVHKCLTIPLEVASIKKQKKFVYIYYIACKEMLKGLIDSVNLLESVVLKKLAFPSTVAKRHRSTYRFATLASARRGSKPAIVLRVECIVIL